MRASCRVTCIARASYVSVVQIDLTDTVVLLTGGSSGIGAATVRSLWGAGASVFFTYLTHEGRAVAIEEECVARFGKLDVLVNNAATGAASTFSSRDYKNWVRGWQRTFDVNVFGAANLAWLAIRHMRKRGTGKIINVASRAAHRGELT